MHPTLAVYRPGFPNDAGRMKEYLLVTVRSRVVSVHRPTSSGRTGIRKPELSPDYENAYGKHSTSESSSVFLISSYSDYPHNLDLVMYTPPPSHVREL